jgi:hypothetical protein
LIYTVNSLTHVVIFNNLNLSNYYWWRRVSVWVTVEKKKRVVTWKREVIDWKRKKGLKSHQAIVWKCEMRAEKEKARWLRINNNWLRIKLTEREARWLITWKWNGTSSFGHIIIIFMKKDMNQCVYIIINDYYWMCSVRFNPKKTYQNKKRS